jgi:hypothetical protein
MAPLEQKVFELSKRVDELSAKGSPTNAENTSRHQDAVEVLIANQQKLQDALMSMQDVLVSSHRLFQEALAAQSKQRSSSCSIC